MTAPDPVTDPVEIRAGVVTVTPKRALEWLKLNTHNRDLRRDRIEAYARDMRNGDWEVNGEAVKFSCGKILLDGQHRLEAVYEAQVDVDMLVVTGLPESAQETMDQGLPRSFGDTLKLRGEPDYLNLAAAVRVVCCFEMYGVPFRPNARPQPTISQQARTLERNPEIRDSLTLMQKHRRAWLPVSKAAAMHYLTATADQDLADTFFGQLGAGTGLDGTEPVYVLRERLIADHESSQSEGMRLRERVKLAFIVRAWNATRRGEQIQRLLWDPAAAFPAIDGLTDVRERLAA